MYLISSVFTLLSFCISPNTDSTSKIAVRSVQIVGLQKTRLNVIEREYSVHEGDTLSKNELEKKVELDRQKIWNTNLFLTLQPKISIDSTNQADILYTVKERFYILALPVISLADRNFNEWWYDRGRDFGRLIYSIHGTYDNFTGRRDKLRIRAEFGFIPRLEISYQRPYIDKAQKTGYTIGITRIVNRNLAYRTNTDKLVFLSVENRTRERIVPFLTLQHRPKFYGTHYFGISYSRSKLSDTIASLNTNYFLNGQTKQNYVQLAYTYLYDRRDNSQYPLLGKVWSVQVVRSGVLPSDNVNIWESTINWAEFKPLSTRWFFSYNAEAKVSTPLRQPFLQTRGLGYFNDLVRGYELYVIDGQHYAYAHTNLRYKLFDRVFKLKFLNRLKQFNALPIAVYPNIYLDAGYVKNYYPELNNSKLANRTLVGGGIGLDFVTWYNFVLRLNYSTNHLGEWRPYFLIGREF